MVAGAERGGRVLAELLMLFERGGRGRGEGGEGGGGALRDGAGDNVAVVGGVGKGGAGIPWGTCGGTLSFGTA